MKYGIVSQLQNSSACKIAPLRPVALKPPRLPSRASRRLCGSDRPCRSLQDALKGRFYTAVEFRWPALAALMFLCACAPSSVEDFRCEGEALSQGLASEMRHIQTREDLRCEMPRLRKKFLKLSELLLAAREFRANHPEIEVQAPSFASDELFAELARLYELPGGRELIESAQCEAIERLIK